jgi:hypothetical protein
VDFFCSDFGENGYSPLKYERGILCLVDGRDPSRGKPESSGAFPLQRYSYLVNRRAIKWVSAHQPMHEFATPCPLK